jgi:hypothetical protein
VLQNPYDVPVYIVSYVEPKAMTATVEIYGPPVVDKQYGDVILDFSFQDGGKFGSEKAGMTYVYNATKAPDGHVLGPNETYVYAEPRVGRKVQTFIHYLSLDGDQLAKKDFHDYTWTPKNGTTYVNAATLPTPTPAPTATPPPAPTATPTPPVTTPPVTTPPPETTPVPETSES